jgi:hypothetical protein
MALPYLHELVIMCVIVVLAIVQLLSVVCDDVLL